MSSAVAVESSEWRRSEVVNVSITGRGGPLRLHAVRQLLHGRGTSLILLSYVRPANALDSTIPFLQLSGTPTGALDEVPRWGSVVLIDVSIARSVLSEADVRHLVDRVDAMWRCAGDITSDGEPAALRRVNVDDTCHVREVVTAGRRETMFFHFSTAFLAGPRRASIAFEEELDSSAGFENAYEQSKFEAEAPVPEWSACGVRHAMVLRPSIPITDRPSHPSVPVHSSGFQNRWKEHLNFMPFEASAEVMVRLSRRSPASGMGTCRVVHDHGVSIPALLLHVAAVRPALVPPSPGESTVLDQRTICLFHGFAPYLYHKRRFDDTPTRPPLGDVPRDITVVDPNFTLSGVEAPVRC